MEREGSTGDGCLHLQVNVTTSQAESPDAAVGVRDLHVIVSGDVTVEEDGFATNFLGEDFSYVALLLVEFPVLGGHNLEVFEDIDVRVLPDVLDIETSLGLLV